MNKHFFIVFLFLTLFSSCSTTKFVGSDQDYFKVEILQNNKPVNIRDGVVRLQKAPFTFRVTLNCIQSLDVSASFERYYYDFTLDQSLYACADMEYLKGCRFTGGKAVAESEFNVERRLMVGNEDFQCNWFYDPQLDWHRYDKGIQRKGCKITAEKTIEKLFDLELWDRKLSPEERDIPLTSIEKDLYMVFATDQDGKQELQRERFIIRFE